MVTPKIDPKQDRIDVITIPNALGVKYDYRIDWEGLQLIGIESGNSWPFSSLSPATLDRIFEVR